MNSSNEVVCNLLELKITVALLPEREQRTTAMLTEASAVGPCLLPSSILLDVTPTSALRAARQAPEQACSTTKAFVGCNIFSSDSSVTFLL